MNTQEAKDKKEIMEILLSNSFPIHIKSRQISLERRSEGKTARVYKVNAGKNIFAVKVFEPNQWHSREISILQENVQNVIPDTVEIIYASDDKRFLILKWLAEFTNSNYKTIDYMNLGGWILKKTLASREHLKDKKIDIEKQMDWMIEAPFSYVNRTSYIEEYPMVKDIIGAKEYIKKMFLEIANAKLPVVIEHGDLEPQNILVNKYGEVKIIDWAASFKSFGLLDIAQLRKNLYFSEQIDSFRNIELFLSPYWELSNFTQSVILFSIIRQIQVLQYCHENNFPSENIQLKEALETLVYETNQLI